MIRTVGKVFTFLLLAGLAVALLRAFNWDLISLVTWVWDFCWNAVMTVADFLTSNPTFQRAVDSPS